MKRFHILDPECGGYACTAYGRDKRDALNRYRRQWYRDRQRLPAGVQIW
jgi:hypothetical protein